MPLLTVPAAVLIYPDLFLTLVGLCDVMRIFIAVLKYSLKSEIFIDSVDYDSSYQSGLGTGTYLPIVLFLYSLVL